MRVVCVTYWFAKHTARQRMRSLLVRRLRRLGPCVRVGPSAWLVRTALSFSRLNDVLSGSVERVVGDPERVPHRLILFPVSQDSGWAMGFSGEDARGEEVAEWLFQQLGDVG